MLKKLLQIPNIWRFLIIVSFIFIGVYFFSPEKGSEAFLEFLILLKKLLPSLGLVFLFMFLFNFFVSDKILEEYFKQKPNIKQYIVIAILGVLSTGPIYLWYAHLSRLQKRGMSNSLISIFLYNRAVKLPLIPLMISYFSLKITIIVSILIIVFSFINALLINLFYNENSNRIDIKNT